MTNLKETFMKSTLPMSEWYGIRPPPQTGMIGSRERYSKTRAPELIPLTTCTYNNLCEKNLTESHNFKRHLYNFSPTCPKRIEILANDLNRQR